MGLMPPEQIAAYVAAQRQAQAARQITALDALLRLDAVAAQAFTQKGIDLSAAATTDAGDLTTGTLDPARLGVTAGTTTASRPLVVDTNKRLDELVLGTLKLGAGAGTAVAATAAELNKVAGVTDGTAAANKAAVLGAGKDLDLLRLTTLEVANSDTTFTRGGAGVPKSNGTLALTSSGSAASLANNGSVATASVGQSRVAPTSVVTGIVLTAGTVDGQRVIVRNEGTSGSTLTFAADATSNVKNGASITVADGEQQEFVWNSSDSRWWKIT